VHPFLNPRLASRKEGTKQCWQNRSVLGQVSTARESAVLRQTPPVGPVHPTGFPFFTIAATKPEGVLALPSPNISH
jgi:hypothetical protein